VLPKAGPTALRFAAQFFRVALDRQLLAPEGLWRALRVAAAAESHLDRRDAALADYDAALVQIESLRAGLAQNERSSFFSNTVFVYDEYIAYLRDLDRRFPGKGYDRKALEIFERKSARAVLEQIGQSAAQHFRGVPPNVVADENAADGAVDQAQSLLSKLLSTTGADRIAIASAEQDLAEAKAHVAPLEASIKAQYPAYYELRHPQPLVVQCRQSPCPTIAGFQQSVLWPGELMLVYDLLKGHSVLWLIDRDRVQLVPLAGSADVDKAVDRLGAHVVGIVGLLGSVSATKLERDAAADLPGFASDSYALYRLIVPDAAASAIGRAKSLIVVPSGSLYRLAFETLVSKDPTNAPQPHYLIEDVPVTYIPSASLLAVVRASYAQPSAGRNPLLAFANPTFGAAAPADARGLSAYAGLQLAAARSAFRGDTGATTVSETVFPSLPGTQTEANDVRTALGAPAASLVTGDAATRQRVLALNASDSLKTYQYVLFATHAVLPSEIKGLTQPAIVLAHPERGDGLLTMGDVFGLSLDADFVTLSACSTGVATGEASGEGISGLTRAFLYAGTPAISVTLWQVDDAAAPKMTPAFFAGMHAGKLTAAEALRRAKLTMLKSPEARFRHPYAWGPSVIFGDGNRRE
jgi:CHAT domain-containing protein